MNTTTIKRRPKSALVVAILALAVALGGTATAAQVLTGKQIRNATITGKDVKNRTLGAKKLKKGALRSLAASGAQGSQGPVGPAGPQGPVGPSQALVDNTPTQMGPQASRVLEVAVGPGSYTAQVNLEVHATGQTAQVDCRFRGPADSDIVLLGYTGTQYIGDVAASGQIDSRFISYGGAFTTAAGGVVEMFCKSGPEPAESMDGDLVVTKVGEVIAQD